MKSCQEVKELRQRLGWSAAELARRLGVSAETVLGVEQGTIPFHSELRNQLLSLSNFVDANADRMASVPVAETVMRDLGVDQIEVEKILEKKP